MSELVGIIGDVHGCYLTFTSLYAEVKKYCNEVYSVGDLIDRGARSKDVVDFVIENEIKTVRGNHEDILMKAFRLDETKEKSLVEIYNHHFRGGGDATFLSYKNTKDNYTIADYMSAVKDAGHLDFMKNMPIMIELPKIIISHAGIIKNATEQDIIWNREKPLLKLNKLQVIGHTPHDEVKYEKNWYANIDTACVYGNKLTAIIVDKNTAEIAHVLQLNNIDV